MKNHKLATIAMLLVVSLAVFNACSDKKKSEYTLTPKTDWEAEALLGKVKVMEFVPIKRWQLSTRNQLDSMVAIYYTYFNERGYKDSTTAVTYNRSADRPEYPVRPIHIFKYYDSGELYSITDYTNQNFEMPDGPGYYIEYYDKLRNLTSYVRYDYSAQSPDKVARVDSTIYEYKLVGKRMEEVFMNGKSLYTATYDKHRNMLQKVRTNDGYREMYEYLYNREGQVTEKIEYIAQYPPYKESKNEIFRHKFISYNEKGLVVSSIEKDSFGKKEKNIEYDDYGNEVLLKKYKYTYDSHHNWIMATPINEWEDEIERNFTYYE